MQKFVVTLINFALLLLPVATLAQQQSQQLKTQTPEQDDVVRISSDLVQIDAVVTDKDGNQVTDLTKDDFEILQDGKSQRITGFSYVKKSAATENNLVESKSPKLDKNAPLPPPVRTDFSNANRIIAFVVDDGSCRASFSGMIAVRDALEKFIAEQMQPTDLVAIYRTRAGSGLLQQYTSDKNQLMQVALRDAESKKLGAANQFVEIPNLKKSTLAVSGLSLSGVDANGKFVTPVGAKIENAFAPTATLAVPALRQFAAGSVVAYAYTIYNAANPLNLTVQVKIYRDGEVVFDGQSQSAQIENQTDATRINDYGYLKLNRQLQPGDYALQIIVRDEQLKQVSAQWIDFEIIY